MKIAVAKKTQLGEAPHGVNIYTYSDDVDHEVVTAGIFTPFYSTSVPQKVGSATLQGKETRPGGTQTRYNPFSRSKDEKVVIKATT